MKTPILSLTKKRIYSEDDLEKPRGQFPYSPKLVSFPRSLQPLIWVYAVCICLSVPIFRFFKFLIRVSFVCISDENNNTYIYLYPGKCGVRSSLFRFYCLKGANCICLDDEIYESDPALFYESGADPG